LWSKLLDFVNCEETAFGGQSFKEIALPKVCLEANIRLEL
jgi:hypothetical protein